MKKILILLIVIVIIITVGFGIYFNNYKQEISIIRDLSKKQEEILNIDNYYQKITATTDTAQIIIEHYKKREKTVTFVNIIMNDSNEVAKEIMYCNGEDTATYIENGKEEIIEKNSFVFSMIPVNLAFANSSDKEIKEAIKNLDISIKNTRYNNKDCYIYTTKYVSEVYFEKETGLVLKYHNSEYEFEFNNVGDEIFELDLSGFTLFE